MVITACKGRGRQKAERQLKKKRSSNAANSFKEEEGRDYMRFDITEHERLGGLEKSITGYRSQTQALFYLLTVQQVRRAQLVALKVCCGQFLLLLLLG